MGRNPCCAKNGVKKGAWLASEDKILTDYITAHGEGKWREIPKKSGLKRCGKSCRLRWLNYLRPDIKRGNISADEEDLIIRLHRLLGNRWSLIAGRLPGRTDNEIKNYWNTYLAKKPQSSLNNNISHSGLDSPLPKPAETTLFSSPTAPSPSARNHDFTPASLESNNVQTCSAPVPWINEHDFQQDYSDFSLDFAEEDLDNFFTNFTEFHPDQTFIGTESLQTNTSENWVGFNSSASAIGSGAEGKTAIEDWLGNILY